MRLLLSPASLAARRVAVAGPLRPLAESLADELTPLATRDIYFPAQKALLSREGGRCARDGTLLAFDPYQPHEHQCPLCGERYTGEMHDRFWIYWYQLWLGERAVHAAALSVLGVPGPFAALASSILDGYAERYSSYPNIDNVLGPTRLFFSTYLESIWLLQICVAADLVSDTQPALADRVRERIVEPSRAIIAEYNEGASNRQVWNAVAILAASRLLDDTLAARDAVHGPGGIESHLAGGLLPDGTWYEGENYHLFAHRGLWYGVSFAEQAGLEMPSTLLARFHRGFLTPFLSALPDFTLPSRRDSQYAISLRQWRIAEHCELGFARTGDSVLGGVLARLYRDDIPRRDTNRKISSADVERNAPASSLTRADLGWRALLCANETLPALEPIVPRSALLEAQGLAVFRRNEGRSYVALDYGHSGGGHGHPDRLNVLLVDDETRWLDDYGTGSYVDPSLHWYRSTLAHNAPLVDGKSQRPVDGRLVAYEERGAAGWISATAKAIAPGVSVSRTLVAMSDYVIDELTWTSESDVTIDLPIHADLELDSGVAPLEAGMLGGGGGTEDGFRFALAAGVQRSMSGASVHGAAQQGAASLGFWAVSDAAVEWWRAAAPGPPGAPDRTFRIARSHGSGGRLVAVLAWTSAAAGVEFGDAIRVTMFDGSRHEHSRNEAGWHIELFAASARSGIDLAGTVAAGESERASQAEAAATNAIELAADGTPTTLSLAEAHYRRSEERWAAAGSPNATVVLAWRDGRLHIEIDVPVSALTFPAANAVNRYDNEHPDINGDSVQLYVSTDAGKSAWMLVPEMTSSAVRSRRLEGWTDPASLEASWIRAGSGYRIVADVGDIVPQAIDIIVNEMPAGRERRRGQLVLSGGAGDFVYLRGDRHEAPLIPLIIRDV